MRDADHRNAKRAKIAEHARLGALVEMTRRFVEKENSRLPVQRACEQNALHLAAGKARATIANRSLNVHWQRLKIFPDRGQSRGVTDAASVGREVETTDIVGDRTLEKPVKLQHDAELLPERVDVPEGRFNVVEAHGTAIGSQPARQQPQ